MASIASVRAFLALTAFHVAVAGAEEAFSPQDYPVDRYSHIWTSSPFVAATETVAESQPLAARFKLNGIAKINGEDIVFLLDRTAIKEFSIRKSKPNPEFSQVELVSVENGGTTESMKVRIKSGGEVGDLTYDKTAMTAPTQNNMAAISNTNPVPPLPNGGIPVPPQPGGQGQSVQNPAGNNGGPRPVRVIRRPRIKADGNP